MAKARRDDLASAQSTIGQYAIAPLWLILNPDVKDFAIRLFILLAAKYADRESSECYPSRRALADDLGVARSTIDLALRQLETAGALTITQQRNESGDLTTNLYTVHFNRPEGVDRKIGQGGGPKNRSTLTEKPGNGRPKNQSVVRNQNHRNQNHLPERDRAADAAPALAVDEVDFSDILASELVEPAPVTAPARFTLTDLQQLWNDIAAAAGCIESRATNAALEQQARARLREYPERAWWEQLLRDIAASDFLTGRNDKGWRASFAWTLKPTNLLKIIEGSYSNRTGARPAPQKVLRLDVGRTYTAEEQDAIDAKRKAIALGDAELRAQAEAAIDAMPLVAKDALMVAAAQELDAMGLTLEGEDYRRCVRRNMVMLITDSAKGRTIADAVADFIARHGGAMTA